ncbi:probable nucleoporin Nup54 isoform X1 [Nilaparvata lugens]|nr:probable nucleoporin Nup54 isoform X1 [Nilaparvata lugens]
MPSLFNKFGQTSTAPSTSLGGGFGTSSGGLFGGFGTSSGGLGTNTGTLGGTPSFGQGLGLGQTQLGQTQLGQTQLGQTQQQQLQQQQLLAAGGGGTHSDAVCSSVLNCHVFGDERDQVLAKWNLLQALWGTGKGYYSQTAPPVEYTPQNMFCRFKYIGYSRKPTAETKDALVALTFNKKDEEIKTQETQLIQSLNSVFGNRPNIIVNIDSIKPLAETKSLVLIYVQEKGQNGALKRVSHNEIVNFLLQPMQKQQMINMGADHIYPFVAIDADQLKEYLDTAPAGIDSRLWKSAQLDNPDPDKLIPVPIIGFNELRWRARCQEQETKVHQAVLDRISEDIAELQRRQSETVAKITEYRQRFLQLEHRVLKVLVKQEITRNVGVALRPEEDVLRNQLDALKTQINMPTHFKGRLSELLSQMRLQRQEATQRETSGGYSMDPTMKDDIRQYLMMEQNGMAHLIEVIQNDLQDLKLMKEGTKKLLSS